jgi:hypothetical protein
MTRIRITGQRRDEDNPLKPMDDAPVLKLVSTLPGFGSILRQTYLLVPGSDDLAA